MSRPGLQTLKTGFLVMGLECSLAASQFGQIYSSLPEASSSSMRKPVFVLCEQHPRSLISVFVIRCLDSIIPPFSIIEI